MATNGNGKNGTTAYVETKSIERIQSSKGVERERELADLLDHIDDDIMRTIRYFGGPEFDESYIEEAAQDTRLVIAEKIDSFKLNETPISHWASVIARNKTLHYRRRWYRDNSKVVYVPEVIENALVTGYNPPEKDILNKENRSELYDKINDLPPRMSQVFTLKVQGYSNKEIAAELNTSVENVRKTSNRGMKKLRVAFDLVSRGAKAAFGQLATRAKDQLRRNKRRLLKQIIKNFFALPLAILLFLLLPDRLQAATTEFKEKLNPIRRPLFRQAIKVFVALPLATLVFFLWVQPLTEEYLMLSNAERPTAQYAHQTDPGPGSSATVIPSVSPQTSPPPTIWAMTPYVRGTATTIMTSTPTSLGDTLPAATPAATNDPKPTEAATLPPVVSEEPSSMPPLFVTSDPTNIAMLPATPTPTETVIEPSPANPTTTVSPQLPIVEFWAADQDTLGWEILGIKEAYISDVTDGDFENEGITGPTGWREVEPDETTKYELRAVHLDGSIQFLTVTIEVEPDANLPANTPESPPQPTPTDGAEPTPTPTPSPTNTPEAPTVTPAPSPTPIIVTVEDLKVCAKKRASATCPFKEVIFQSYTGGTLSIRGVVHHDSGQEQENEDALILLIGEQEQVLFTAYDGATELESFGSLTVDLEAGEHAIVVQHGDDSEEPESAGSVELNLEISFVANE